MKVNDKIRYNLENNSYLQTKNWQGQGQPELIKVAATKWRVLVNDPNKYEGCEIHSFDNLAQAKAFIKEHQK